MTPAGIEGSTFSGHLIRTPIYWVIIVLGRVLINARMSGFGDDSALAMSLEYG